jgi:gas vesicle protein
MSEVERLEADEPSWEEMEDRGVGRGIILLLAGIGIGAGLALLLTPRRGEEVRDAIGRGYRKTVEGLTERAQDLRDRARDLGERARDLRDRAPNLLRFTRRKVVERRYRER